MHESSHASPSLSSSVRGVGGRGQGIGAVWAQGGVGWVRIGAGREHFLRDSIVTRRQRSPTNTAAK